MATIFHQVLIEAPLETVYQNLSLQKGLAQWWIADCTAQPEVGFINLFRVPEFGVNKMKVLQLEDNALVEWECLNEKDEWSGTRIRFELQQREQWVCLNFKHMGYKEQNELYATCNYHWARHLFMLKHLCETGISLLNKEKEAREVRAAHGK